MRRREFIALMGATAACSWAVKAPAQQSAKVVRIGLLRTGNVAETEVNIDAFRQGLIGLGYSEGANFVIEQRVADGRIERLPGLAKELVALKVDIIVAAATPAGRAAQRATSMIPIVVTAMGDPVTDGLVASLARPGGNITGTSFLGPELAPKRLAFLNNYSPRSLTSRVSGTPAPSAIAQPPIC